MKVGKEAVETTYTTVQGKFPFVFSGDPLKKTEDFYWIAKFNSAGLLSINFVKPIDISYLLIYNYPEKSRYKLLGIRRLQISMNKATSSSRIA